MSISAQDFFTRQQQDAIRQAVMDAEMETSGEIRIHIENKCEGDVLDRASFLFLKLKMNKTELRNGVLIYLAVQQRKFAIIGDKGINKVVPENFWDSIKEKNAGTISGKGILPKVSAMRSFRQENNSGNIFHERRMI